MDLGSVR